MALRYLSVLALAFLAGCASKPVVVDNTSLKPTALFETYTSNNGIKGFFPSESTEREFFRADRERQEIDFKGTGTVSRFIIGSRSTRKITRVDRKLLWGLNTEKEEYTECPLKGCVRPAAVKQPAEKPQQPPPEAPHEQGCTVHVAKNEFTVTPTGKKQDINGFKTEEYQVEWDITLRDPQSRNSVSKLGVDIWTAEENSDMKQAMHIKANFNRSFADAVRAEADAKPPVIPPEATRLIMSYLAGVLHSADRNAFFEAGKQLQKLKGYPILTKISWGMAGNACMSKEEEKQAKHGSESPAKNPDKATASDLVSGIAGNLFGQKSGKSGGGEDNEPLLSFTVEVKQIKVAPQHDSLFEVPAGYRKIEQN